MFLVIKRGARGGDSAARMLQHSLDHLYSLLQINIAPFDMHHLISVIDYLIHFVNPVNLVSIILFSESYRTRQIKTPFSVESPLLSSLTSSLFRSRRKTHLFNKSV